MNIRVRDLKVYIVFYLLLVVCVAYSQYSNEVLQVFHNKAVGFVVSNSQKAGGNPLELGNVVFYFSEKPIVNFVPERKSKEKKGKKVFIFPKAGLKSKICQNSVKQINTVSGVGYSLKIEKVTLPIEGVKLSITYDPGSVKIDYKMFESVANKQGVIFSFYNKKLINKIKNKENNVLCIV